MSAFLWVEDFEGNQYQEFTNNIFGKAFGLRLNEIPNNDNYLRKYLEDKNVYLVSTFAEADNFINSRLADIDFVILDIDLKTFDEYSDDIRPVALANVLTNWYGYDANASIEDKSFNEACDRLKPEAGYHIWKNLVMQHGFSRDRILFCSNHAGYLDTIKSSFSGAKIDTPEIYEKRDPFVEQWVNEKINDPYSVLRRGVIMACRELLNRVNTDPTTFKLPNITPNREPKLDINNAKILLETIPLLMPQDASPPRQLVVFRILIRTLTQDWDKQIDFKNMDLSSDKAMATALKAARNFTSHDGEALSRMNVADVTFLFLICLRMSFDLGKNIESFEAYLFNELGLAEKIDNTKLECQLTSLIKTIQDYFDALDAPQKLDRNNMEIEQFDRKVNALQEAGRLPVESQMHYLKLLFWQQLYTKDKGRRFDPPKNLSPFVAELTKRIYGCSFNVLQPVLSDERSD